MKRIWEALGCVAMSFLFPWWHCSHDGGLELVARLKIDSAADIRALEEATGDGPADTFDGEYALTSNGLFRFWGDCPIGQVAYLTLNYAEDRTPLLTDEELEDLLKEGLPFGPDSSVGTLFDMATSSVSNPAGHISLVVGDVFAVDGALSQDGSVTLVNGEYESAGQYGITAMSGTFTSGKADLRFEMESVGSYEAPEPWGTSTVSGCRVYSDSPMVFERQ